MKIIVLIVICTMLFAAGQVCWKLGLQKEGFSLTFEGLKALAGSFPIWAGFIVFGIATVLWFQVLSKTELSYAYPLVSLSYVFGLIGAKYCFHEAVTPTRWLGVLLICLGVALVAK